MQRTNNSKMSKWLCGLPLVLCSWGCMESAPQQTTTTTNTEPDVPVTMIVQESPQTETRTSVEGFDFATIGTIAVDLQVTDPRNNPLGDATVQFKGADGTMLMRARTGSDGRLLTQLSYRLADEVVRVEISKPFYATQDNTYNPEDLSREPLEVMLPLDVQEEEVE